MNIDTLILTETIVYLRSQRKTYKQISKELGYSISYIFARLRERKEIISDDLVKDLLFIETDDKDTKELCRSAAIRIINLKQSLDEALAIAQNTN